MKNIRELNQQEINSITGGIAWGQWIGAGVGALGGAVSARALPIGGGALAKMGWATLGGAVVFSSVWVGGLTGGVIHTLISQHFSGSNQPVAKNAEVDQSADEAHNNI